MQKYNEKQLREMYFTSQHDDRSLKPNFSQVGGHRTRNQQSKSRSYRKFTNEEVTHFETIFNRYREQREVAYRGLKSNSNDKNEPPVTNILEKPDHNTTTHESLPSDNSVVNPLKENRFTDHTPHVKGKTLGELIDGVAPLKKEENPVILTAKVEEVAPIVAVEKDEDVTQEHEEPPAIPNFSRPLSYAPYPDTPEAKDDLDYLDALVSNAIGNDNQPSLGSLGDIFDEIVGNEQHSITNYKSDVFDANIQRLFEQDPEKDEQTTPQSQPPNKALTVLLKDQLTESPSPDEKKSKRKKLDVIDLVLIVSIFATLSALIYLYFFRG